MPIRKRGGVWHIDFTPRGGSRIRETAGRDATREEALEIEAKLRRDHHAGVVGRAPRRTVSEAFKRWLNGEVKGLAYPKDLASKVSAFDPYLQGRHLSQAADVAEEAKAAWIKAGLNVITINRRLAALRRIVNLAWKKWRWLDRPIAIELLRGEQPRTVRLTPKQAEKYFRSFDDVEARDRLLLEILSGLRPGELRSLPDGDNVKRGRLVIVASKTWHERSIPLVPQARAIARKLPHVNPDRLRYAHERARDRAGMPWLQMRDLRRTFGSWIVQRTKSLKVAQELLGHKNIAITARHYALLLDEHLERAVKTLPKFGKMKKRLA